MLRRSLAGSLALALSIAGLGVFAFPEPAQASDWRAEHEARIRNAAKVCDGPAVDAEANPLNPNNGFYTINLIAGLEPRYLGIDDRAEVTLRPAQAAVPTRWLLSRVGAGLYHIANCHQGRPICLHATSDRAVTLAPCEPVGYGTQTWWMKGFIGGPNDGGWYLGSDGISAMECLVVDYERGAPALQECAGEHTGWRLTRVEHQATTEKKTEPLGGDLLASSARQQYRCDSGETVVTAPDSGGDRLWVQYRNETVVLEPVPAASGVKYAAPGHPWGWWTKGDRGSIFVADGDAAFIENCVEDVDPAGFAGALGAEPERVWSSQGQGAEVTAADCTDCEEDLGMLIACRGQDRPALVTLHWLAGDKPAGSSDLGLHIEVGGRVFERMATTTHYGMIGHTPQFELASGDPLLAALQQGDQVRFSTGDSEVSIGLRGSRQALDLFIQQCGWR